MSLSPARKAAFQMLRLVEGGRAFAVDLLQGPHLSGLQEADRRLVTELVMGVLRWRGELDYQIERVSGKPLQYFDAEIATLLRMGIYQIRFLEKIPKAAAVNQAVELVKSVRKRSAAGLVNAVLRKCSPGGRRLAAKEATAADAEFLQAARRSIPAWLLQRWESNFGRSAADSLAGVSNTVPHTALRICAGEREEIQRELAQEGIETEAAKFGSHALIVRAGNVHNSRLFSEGRIVIQDEASQLAAGLLAPRRGERVLDLCAAPGMKSLQLAGMLKAGTLVAGDLSARRLRTMAGLIAGKTPRAVRLLLLRLDGASDPPFGCSFDRILIDAPCSGTGTLARNPEIKWRLQPKDLPRLADMQAKILGNALRVLAPAGRLVYATCSLEPEENEQVVEETLREAKGYRVLTAAELSSEFPELSALFDPRGYFRTRPDLHSMDGFFGAVIVHAVDTRLALAA